MARSSARRMLPERDSSVFPGRGGLSTCWSMALSWRVPMSPLVAGQSTCTSFTGLMPRLGRMSVTEGTHTAPLSLAFVVGSLLFMAPKCCEFNVPGCQLASILDKARAVLLRNNRQQRHRKGIHNGVVGVTTHRVDDGEFPWILEHLPRMRFGIKVQPPPPLDESR